MAMRIRYCGTHKVRGLAQWMRLSSPWNLVMATMGLYSPYMSCSMGRIGIPGKPSTLRWSSCWPSEKDVTVSTCQIPNHWVPQLPYFRTLFRLKSQITLRLSWWPKNPVISQVKWFLPTNLGASELFLAQSLLSEDPRVTVGYYLLH